MAIVKIQGRAAFVKVHRAEKVNGEGLPQYSINVILPKGSPYIKQVETAIREVAKEKWKDKSDAVLKQMQAQDRLCLHNGDTKAEYEGFAGNVFVAITRKEAKGRPLVINADKTPLTEADGKPYSGCHVEVSMDVWPQDNEYGKRVNAELRGVQFVKDGDAFAGGAPVATVDEFGDLTSGVDASADVGGGAGDSLV